MTLFPDPYLDVERAAIAGNLYTALRVYGNLSGLGTAFPPGLFYTLWKANPAVERARVPDASYIRRERLPAALDTQTPFQGAPDFAACVVSQAQMTMFTLDNVRDYLNAGTEQVWMVYTYPREVHVFLRDVPQTIRVYTGEAVIDGAHTLPDFKITMAQVFQAI